MPVIKTNVWAKNDESILDQLIDHLPDTRKNEDNFKTIILTHGLDPSDERSKVTMEQLRKKDTWTTVNNYYKKYKNMWNGPDIPVYILPINSQNKRLIEETNGKSGVAFPNTSLLFLSNQATEKEIEALVVHEYHHVCRFRSIQRKPDEFTLLDSIVMEGLAEHAVKEYCGEKYLAKWNQLYSEKQLKAWWKRWFYPNLSISNEKKSHDSLLYGRKMLPMMVGYSIGFFLISEFAKVENFSTKIFIAEPSESFVLQDFDH